MPQFYVKKKSGGFRLAYKCLAPFSGLARLPGHKIASAQAEPFFIIGCGRSGTTLLRKLLFANEGVYIPPESYVLGPMYYCFIRHRQLNWPDLVNLVVSRLFFHEEFHTFRMFEKQAEIVSVLQALPRQQQTFGDLVDRLYREFARHQGRESISHWGDKTPMNTLWLEELAETFPRARFIHLLRDGRDVVSSYTKSDMKPFSNALDRWVSSMKLVEEFMASRSGKVIEVKYEDLVSRVDEEMLRIATFLGLDPATRFWDAADRYAEALGDASVHQHHAKVLTEKGVSTGSIGKGAREWNDEKVEGTGMLDLFKRYQRHYGYEQ